jgi:hypothetical protein
MSDNLVSRKALWRPAIVLCAIACFALTANSTDKTYSPKNAEEIDLISIVLASESAANNWTNNDLICLSVKWKDPAKPVVKALRKLGLNVCKQSDWEKHFICGFHVDLLFISFDSSQTVRLRVSVADFREINNGSAHIAALVRDGEYSIRKNEGKWSLVDYVPSKSKKASSCSEDAKLSRSTSNGLPCSDSAE